MLVKLGLAAFLLAHAAIHTGFLAPRPPATAAGPPWPFDLARSWLLGPLDPEVRRGVALVLVAITIAGFGLAALATLEVAPTWAWPAGVAIGSMASLSLLVVFFHPWLIVGVAIDVALLWAIALARWEPGWPTT